MDDAGDKTLVLPDPIEETEDRGGDSDSQVIEEYVIGLLQRIGGNSSAVSGPETARSTAASAPAASPDEAVADPETPPAQPRIGIRRKAGQDGQPSESKTPSAEDIMDMRAVANRHAHRTLSTQGLIRQAYAKLVLAIVAIVTSLVLFGIDVLVRPINAWALCIALLVAVVYSAQYVKLAGRLAAVPQEDEEAPA